MSEQKVSEPAKASQSVESNEGLNVDKPSESADITSTHQAPEPTKVEIKKVDEMSKVEGNVTMPSQVKKERMPRKDKGVHKPIPWLHKKKHSPKRTNVYKVEQKIVKPKLNVGFKVGIGLGIFAGVMLALYFWNRMKKKVSSDTEIVNSNDVGIDIEPALHLGS